MGYNRWSASQEYDNQSTTYLDPDFSSYQYTMELPQRHPLMTCAVYLFLTVSLVCTVVLFCGCVPNANSDASILDNIYATQLQVAGDTVNSIKIASFALCTDYAGATSCTTTQGRNVTELAALMYSTANSTSSQEPAVRVALDLQHRVFYGTPVLSSITILLTLLCTTLSHFILDAKTKLFATGLAVLSAAIMLVDGFSTQLALHALQIATSTSSTTSAGAYTFTFSTNAYYTTLQWLSFALTLLTAALLWTRYSDRFAEVAILDAEKAEAARTGQPILEPHVHHGHVGNAYVYPEQGARPRIVERVAMPEPVVEQRMGMGYVPQPGPPVYQRVVREAPPVNPVPQVPGALMPGAL